jgi:hypothetical protein
MPCPGLRARSGGESTGSRSHFEERAMEMRISPPASILVAQEAATSTGTQRPYRELAQA